MLNSRKTSQPFTDLPDRTTVAIVGAGPTGLAAALALANKGIDHVILDKSAPHVGRSRAATVMPLSLEVLEEFGVVDQLVANGLKLDGFSGRDYKRRVASFAFAHLPTKYPYVLVIPQSRTEELMESGLNAAGSGVYRGRELAGLNQDDAGVTLRFADGQTLRADYVVGADGSRSKVREAAGIEFVGYSYPISVVLGDVDVALDPDKVRIAAGQDIDRVRGYLSPHGTMAIVPLPSGRWRVAAPMPKAVRNPDLDDIRAIVKARGPQSIPGDIIGLDWASHFQVQRRNAERYRAGRLFLAGDAAHVHSPVAGQGMNVGIQDGANLGRKLVAVCQGADPALLDQYEAERKAVATRVINSTDRLTRGLMIHTWGACMVRNSLLRIVSLSSRLENRMSMHNSQLVYRGL